MKANSEPRQLETQGTEAVGSFGLSRTNAVHIMTILRDTLYTDRVLAVLREYTSNAWDAHREAGKPDTPIKVTLPTMLEPTLVIRDYGLGMSDEDVLTIYTQYGESSKRDTDDQVGALGIGCKSAFAYTDTFTVTSWYEGKKRVYVAVLDETNVGEMRRLDESPCGDETGIEIKVPVLQHDITKFEEKARYLFTAFRPQPEINIDLPPLPDLVDDIGFIDINSDRWVAVMGCVPYRIDTDQLGDSISDGMKMVGGAVHFDIGEVEISASREDLKYTEKTVTVLRDRMTELQDAAIENMAADLRSKTQWEQRLQVHHLHWVMNFPLPEEYDHLKSSCDSISTSMYTPKHFRWGDKNIRIHKNSTLYLHDDERALKGFSIPYLGVLIRPFRGASLEDIKAELDELMTKMGITGIPIAYTSNLNWYDPRNYSASGSGEVNPKHKVKTFTFKGNSQSYPRSKRWEIVDRVPTDDDVYVPIYRFDAHQYPNFIQDYQEDHRIARYLGIRDEFPTIYGYKPDALEGVKGTHYREWRKTFVARHISDEIRRKLGEWHLVRLFKVEHMAPSQMANIRERLQKGLGKRHLLVKTADRLFRALSDRGHQEMLLLAVRHKVSPKGSTAAHTLLNKYYPLFASMGFFNYLRRRIRYYSADDTIDLWTDYIKMADRDRRHSKEES